ncbi:MAG TPA: VirB4 family type IV secretion/conjugal transfer ATPase [Steroidobacteraceae bacterium]|nr:VirB4 family type IV secretion/conjugal transfer ATPase [Steroidobacteraceae bacterium]
MALSYQNVLRRERLVSEQIPYTVHVSERVLRTHLTDYLQVFRLGGAAFESVDDEQLNNWHERLNILWRNIGAPGVALWVHVIRRRDNTPAPADLGDGFADTVYGKYQRWLRGETLMLNELYLSILHRPASVRTGGLLARALAGSHTLRADTQAALDACDKLAQVVEASLARYEPQALGVYRSGNGWCSSLLEFLGLLLNGERRSMPLGAMTAAESLPSARLLFGTEALEYRLPNLTRVGAFLGIKEYASPSVVGLLNRLLSAPFAFVLTQSFLFLSKGAGQGLLQRQIHRMANAGDYAISQAAQLTRALDQLTSNEFLMGEHHFSLQVLADVEGATGAAATAAQAAERLRPLNDQLAQARALLADTGMTIAREDLALEAAFWAQLPGNLPLRPRKAPLTSRNFAAMAAFHNYPAGRLLGNHWGEALATFMTSARSPYHFSLHADDPVAAEGGARRDSGHTFICGPTGCGKTVLVGFLLCMLARRQITQIIFDKDRGLEILIRALGGQYLPLRAGMPTGLNPLQLPGTATDVEFLKSWLRSLAGPAQARQNPVRELGELEQALHATLSLERPVRRLSRLVEFLDPTDPEGLHARLSPWCVACQGDYGWVFDNPQDLILPLLQAHPTVGFDVTEFLDNVMLREPLTLYLFHLVRQQLDGQPLVCWMDEFWRMLGDEAFAAFAKDGPKTWRKLNGVMCLATQSPSDVLQSSISRTIIEQTATKIFFPNPEANLQDYTQGFGLTEREFRLVRERLEPGSRRFLIKQGRYSVVAQLDLRSFDAELQVLSGRAAHLERMQALMQLHGNEAARWVGPFLASASAAAPAPLRA